MVEKNMNYNKDSTNKEFIEIYEDEIKRLIKKNEDLHVSLEDKENALKALQNEKIVIKKELEKVNTLPSSIELLTKQNRLYKEKVNSLTKENANLTCIADELKQNTLEIEVSSELSIKLEIEKQKVVSLQEQLNAVIEDKDVNNSLMRQQLTEEKTELGEILLDARMKSKNLIDKANMDAKGIKETANKEIAETIEKTKLMSIQLEKLRSESCQFVSNLIEEVKVILHE